MFDQAFEIICRQLGLSDSNISDDANFFEDLGADSLDIVEMLTELEDECGVNIPDEAIGSLRTVGDLREYLEDCAETT